MKFKLFHSILVFEATLVFFVSCKALTSFNHIVRLTFTPPFSMYGHESLEAEFDIANTYIYKSPKEARSTTMQKKKNKKLYTDLNDYSTVSTPSFGNVRYVEIGPKEGEVVLFVNGGGAGYNGVHAFDWLASSGFRVISINRPGYFDMPLEKAEEFKCHADIYFEVLHQLGITDCINVFGLSMGGLSALHYAKNYPTNSLVLWSAVTGKYEVNTKSANSALGKLVLGDRGKGIISWLLKKSVKYFPKSTIKEFLKTEADLTRAEKRSLANEIVKSQEDLRELNIFVQSMTPMSELYDGMMHEVENASKLDSVDWSTIECPVFAVHSKVDIDVPIEHAQRLEKTLKNIQMKYVNAGGHFVWWGKEGKEVKEDTKEFLIQHSLRQ